MKIKVNMNTLRTVLLIALLMYSLSQQSWGSLISGSVMWRILFIGCVIFGITTLYKFIRTPYLYTFLCVVLMAVVLLFNNQNLANGSNGYELVFSEIILFAATAYKEDYWIKSTIKVMLLLKESRRSLIYLPKNGEKHLVISLIYQTFFLLYGITGTCLYEVPTLVPCSEL